MYFLVIVDQNWANIHQSGRTIKAQAAGPVQPASWVSYLL